MNQAPAYAARSGGHLGWAPARSRWEPTPRSPRIKDRAEPRCDDRWARWASLSPSSSVQHQGEGRSFPIGTSGGIWSRIRAHLALLDHRKRPAGAGQTWASIPRGGQPKSHALAESHPVQRLLAAGQRPPSSTVSPGVTKCEAVSENAARPRKRWLGERDREASRRGATLARPWARKKSARDSGTDAAAANGGTHLGMTELNYSYTRCLI
jgi:hypothetical protein